MNGLELKRLRLRLGFTQKQMAEMLELCNRSYICDMEAGRKPISAKVAGRVAALFKQRPFP